MANKKVAIVTGSNKGIGFAIAKGLLQKFNGDVYITARDERKGNEALNKLKQLGYNPKFHQLDITDQNSINQFKNDIQNQYGGIDILVNNAGIYFKDQTASFGTQAEETLKVNYFGTLNVCHAFFPLLRQNARVINISSALGRLALIPSYSIRNRLANPNLNESQLTAIIYEFLDAAKKGKSVENGWGDFYASPYTVSKVGVTVLTTIQQREFDKTQSWKNIQVNAVHPGYVDTDLTDHQGIFSIERGAQAPLYLALDAQGIKGQFVWHNNKIIDWKSDQEPTD